ncbi:hypothetical protein CFRS1_v011470 [Colletotrichum fructicola]|nr:hypothetical protein CFRS1_v011470 [Colletotrichum fructicola]
MPLPPEIIDQIVDQYVSVARIQTFHEVRDLDEWVNFTGGRDSTAVFYGGENEPYESTFFRNQLRKLRLVIVDETGPGGSDWQMISDGDDYNDGDFTDIAGTGYAPSNIQVDYPNREHQDALWAFVGSCQRLESLAIIASHYLELDRLRWIPQPGYRGLVDLVLHRIWTNVQSILKLLTVAPVNETKLTPVARRVSLEDIKVAPTWNFFAPPS